MKRHRYAVDFRVRAKAEEVLHPNAGKRPRVADTVDIVKGCSTPRWQGQVVRSNVIDLGAEWPWKRCSQQHCEVE